MDQEAWRHPYTFQAKVPGRFKHLFFLSTPWLPPPGANNWCRQPVFWCSVRCYAAFRVIQHPIRLFMVWGLSCILLHFNLWQKEKHLSKCIYQSCPNLASSKSPGLFLFKKVRASLVAPWLIIRLPMQRTQVRSLVREDPTCCRATKPVHHN